MVRRATDRLEGPQVMRENQQGDSALSQGVPDQWSGSKTVMGGGVGGHLRGKSQGGSAQVRGRRGRVQVNFCVSDQCNCRTQTIISISREYELVNA